LAAIVIPNCESFEEHGGFEARRPGLNNNKKRTTPVNLIMPFSTKLKTPKRDL